MDISFKIISIYQELLYSYKEQGWWPFLDIGYHPKDYSYPKNHKQIFEISLGVILTQNTTFNSVVKSLENLQTIDCIDPLNFKNSEPSIIKEAIRPSGYFNQKYQYILNLIKFFEKLDKKIPTRYELLSVKGIGEESADSILLYAYNQEEFVIDAYTKRLCEHLGFVQKGLKYKDIKIIFENAFKDHNDKVRIYQEYHALIVRHAKDYYSKKPYGEGCFLNKFR